MHQYFYQQVCNKLGEVPNTLSTMVDLAQNKNFKAIQNHLTELQKNMIQIGSFIEELNETSFNLNLIEDYCEVIYNAYENFQTHHLSALSKGLHEIVEEFKTKITVSKEELTVDIIGSCVSRIILLNGDRTAHGTASPYVHTAHFFDKNNIALCMSPPPFRDEEVESIKKEELYDPSRIHSLKQGLNKKTIELLLQGPAEYLMLDLYDFQVFHGANKTTTFSNCSYEFFNTRLFEKYKAEICAFNLLDMEKWLVYPYVDLFFKTVMTKFDRNHIILNRFRSNSHYINEKGEIVPLPDNYLMPYHANYKYNKKLQELEDYIIEHYSPYVIDLSGYFVCDAAVWENLNGAHFEIPFYTESYKAFLKIVLSRPEQRIFDQLSPSVVADLLEKNLRDQELLKYLSLIRNPFHTGTELDSIYIDWKPEEVVKHRYEIAEDYRKLQG